MLNTHASHLKDKHLLITGGGSGVGAAIAQSFAAAGANVSILGRRKKALHDTAKGYSNIFPATADVCDEASLNDAFTKAREEFGPINIVIANAGTAETAPFERTDLDQWNRMISTNLTGTFLTIKNAYEDMKASGEGRIIAIASTAGQKGYSYVVPYCAAKHGVVGLVKGLALEAARTNITVNAICPGFIETPMLETSINNIKKVTGRSEEEARKSLYAGNPQKRFIQVEEVAAMAQWLCAPGSESITGQALSISGGET